MKQQWKTSKSTINRCSWQKQIVTLTKHITRITTKREIIHSINKFHNYLFKCWGTIGQQKISTPHSHEDLPEVVVDEVEKAFKDMKNDIAAGNDGIPVEMPKYPDRPTWKMFAHIYTNCLKAKKITQNLNNANILLTHMKSSWRFKKLIHNKYTTIGIQNII